MTCVCCPISDLPEDAPQYLSLRPTDAAVVMTHSFEQDSRILASLLALDFPLAYLGVLGPQRRTRELLAEAARLLHLPDTEIASTNGSRRCTRPPGSIWAAKRLPPSRSRSWRKFRGPYRRHRHSLCARCAPVQGASAANSLRDDIERAYLDLTQFMWPGALPARPETSPAMPDARSTQAL